MVVWEPGLGECERNVCNGDWICDASVETLRIHKHPIETVYMRFELRFWALVNWG